MPFDPTLILYERLRAIWLADAGFLAAFKPGCRLWQSTTTDPRPRNTVAGPGPADYPRFRLDSGEGETGRNIVKVFVNPDGSDMPNVGVPIKRSFPVSIVHEKPGMTQQSTAVCVVTNPIVLAAPRLRVPAVGETPAVAGLAWVGGVEWSKWTRRDEKSDVTGGILRTVERATVTITGMPWRSQFAEA